MPYTWRATYGFDYPLMDRPVEIGEITILPAPPNLALEPRAVHYYEFETERVDATGQNEVRQYYIRRLSELMELGILAPHYSEVRFISVVLLSCDKGKGYPPAGLNISWEGSKPYLPPGTSPVDMRQRLEDAAITYQRIQSLSGEPRETISRALRWFYRAGDFRLLADERLIYRWIAFNSIYGLFWKQAGFGQGGDREKITRFEEFFRSTVGQVTEGAARLCQFDLRLNGRQTLFVSEALRDALDNGEDSGTFYAMLCVYAVRCGLLHGDEAPTMHVTNTMISAAAEYLGRYLHQVIPPFVGHCVSQPVA